MPWVLLIRLGFTLARRFMNNQNKLCISHAPVFHVLPFLNEGRYVWNALIKSERCFAKLLWKM